MNLQNIGSTRPKLYPPKALLSMGPMERRSPNLSDAELRYIVIQVIG